MPPLKKSKSSHRRGKDGGGATAKSTQFVRIVFAPVSQGLRIPTCFMQDFCHSLKPNTTVTLKVPTGDSWPVTLRQTNTGLWFGRGWGEFSSYYQVKPKDVLEFKYDGRSGFSVFIMDPCGLEIEYPDREKSEMKVKSEDKSPADDVDENDEAEDEVADNFNANPLNLCAAVRATQGKERFQSYREAEGFRSENPYFLTFMQPTYVTDRYMVGLNLGCAKDFLPKDGSKCVIPVGVPGGNRVWPLSCHVYNGGRKSAVMKGWKEFAVDNKLRVADVCAFELVNPQALHFIITIFRNP